MNEISIKELRADVKAQIESYLIDMKRDCADKSQSIAYLSRALYDLTRSKEFNED